MFWWGLWEGVTSVGAGWEESFGGKNVSTSVLVFLGRGTCFSELWVRGCIGGCLDRIPFCSSHYLNGQETMSSFHPVVIKLGFSLVLNGVCFLYSCFGVEISNKRLAEKYLELFCEININLMF